MPAGGSSEATRIRSKYPDRVPVICEKAPRSNLPSIEKKKFLVPGTMLVGEFKYIIHKHINQCHQQQGGGGATIAADQTIYLFTDSGMTPKTGSMMQEVYHQHKADDQFLYIQYSAENTLGA